MNSEQVPSQLNIKAGMAGFEPANDDTKSRCLTTWLHPNDGYTIAQKRQYLNNAELSYVFYCIA